MLPFGANVPLPKEKNCAHRLTQGKTLAWPPGSISVECASRHRPARIPSICVNMQRGPVGLYRPGVIRISAEALIPDRSDHKILRKWQSTRIKTTPANQKAQNDTKYSTYWRCKFPSDVQGPICHRLCQGVSSLMTAPVCQSSPKVGMTSS